jgi:hypothetical protein
VVRLTKRRKLSKTVIIGVIAIIVIAIISIILIENAVSSAISSYHPSLPPHAINSSLSMQNAFFGNYANSTAFAAYAKLNYHVTNASYAGFTLRVFKTDPIPKIYLVDTDNYCINCFLGSTMQQYLQNYLSQFGLLLNQSSFNYIQLNNISSVPPNSIIIVPSGLIPLSFLPIQNSSLNGYNACPLNYNYSIINMLNKGDTIFYVGDNFSNTVSCGQQIIQTPQSIINQLSSIGLGTRPANATDIITAKNQTYLTFNSPTFLFTSGYVGPSSTYVNVLNGSVVALTNYPSKGWNNASTLSRDIAALINLHSWNGELASGSTGYMRIKNNSSSGQIGLVTNTTQASLQSLTNISLSSTYVLGTSYFYNSAGQLKENNILFGLNGLENGYVSITSPVPQTASEYISAGATNITNAYDSFHIYIYNLSYNNPVQYLFIGQMKPNVTFIKPISFSLLGGYYIASLIDSNNHTYARAIFRIYNTNITAVRPFSFSNRTFTFSLHSGDYPLTGIPYSISINGQYVQNGTVNNSIIQYSLPGGSVLSYGNETFTIKVLGNTETIIEPYSNTIFNIPAYYIEFAIAAVVIVVLNKILIPPNIDRYYINVQEFGHTDRAKVKEPPETILKVFDQVNYYYHWRYMPLTAEEVKAGISGNVRYGNMPIAVTLQNTYTVLNKMSRKGLIVEAADYYAPKSWEETSKHDIEYLVIFRKLRDYSVSNAMLFTDIDAYDNVDMMITNKGVQNYVYIYSKLSENPKLKNIPLGKSHRTFIVFLNEEDRYDFVDRLNISYGEESEILRMSIDSLDIRLIGTDDLTQLKL